MKDKELWNIEMNKCNKIKKLKKNHNVVHSKKFINVAEIIGKIKEKANASYRE